MIRHQKALSGLRNNRLADANLFWIEIQEIPVGIHGRAAYDRDIEPELANGFVGDMTDERAITATEAPTGDDGLDVLIIQHNVRDVHVVGHDHQAVMSIELACDGFRTGANIEKNRARVWDFPGAGTGHGRLGVRIQRTSCIILNIRRA